ncbi:MAG: hypothetical protein NTZ09_01995 [Candidatus Hydrogenedentes bacterium]|nr:hypothetical protein [Candidatus Hydrogenedentota bacterium]
MRQGDWKLIGNPNDPTKGGALPDPVFLSNLAKDISESENLAGQFPEEVARLEKVHQEWVAGLQI